MNIPDDCWREGRPHNFVGGQCRRCGANVPPAELVDARTVQMMTLPDRWPFPIPESSSQD